MCLASALSQCDRSSSSSTYVHQYRQNLPAAQTAEEWAGRVKVDSEQHSISLEDLYAELPATDQWDKAFELADSSFSHKEKKAAHILKLLLDNKKSEALTAIKKQVKSSSISDYDKDDTIQLLYSLSEDPATTQAWIAAEKPSLLKKKPNKNSSSKDAKKAWEKALANNEVAKGISLLWKEANSSSKSDSLRALNKILRVSKLVDDKDNLQKSLEAIEKVALHPSRKDNVSFYNFNVWINHLIEGKQWSKLTLFTQKQLAASDSDYSRKSYKELALWITVRTATPADCVAKLETHQAEHKLSADSLYSLLKQSYADDLSLGEIYAQALKDLGRDDDAWSVASHMVALKLGNDKSYKLARSLNPEKFELLLKSLHKFDPFEERPLIWQSQLALDKADLELARALIDQAIALDPSDGDQGKNSRMQAYSVLARIFEAQGNSEKANFFDEVVVAIRAGEAADDYLNAGLINEAIERYQKSLGHFNDAYCLQSRLALTLAKNGRFEEAIPHFEKAFNLMPVSFGPRESHCFGCEGLFSDKRVHGIAERILKAFVEKNPDNPRAPYLLGLIYDETKQYEASTAAYQKALEIDPNYYNAANRLISALKKNPTKAHLVQSVVKNAITIAPYSNLRSLFSQRSDIAQTWHDAANHTESPLDLGKLPLLPVTATEQYATDSNWNNGSGIDGWTRDELLRDNNTVESLDDL